MSNERLLEAQRLVAEVKAKRAEEKHRKQEERDAFWKNYYDQLSKATPHEGGAHSKKNRIFRLW